MSWWRPSANERRERARRSLAPSPLADYLEVPFPEGAAPVAEVEFLALDFETTGLDPRQHEIVAVGFVPVRAGRVELAGARSMVVAVEAEVGSSATVHGVTDDQVAVGVPLEEAMTQVLGALAGRVLLAHFADLEVRFTTAACARLWGGPFLCESVDTLALHRRLVTPAFGVDPAPGSLRLWSARERYGLPVYPPHDPLVDAIACAELFLAQVAELGDGGGLSLKSVRA